MINARLMDWHGRLIKIITINMEKLQLASQDSVAGNADQPFQQDFQFAASVDLS
jgi:hypothetical protein